MAACAQHTKTATMLRTLVVVLACLWAVGCNRGGQMSSSDSAASVALDDTTLGPGDVFEVRVFGQDSLTGKYRVATDGTIQFPFLGLVAAGGKEPEAVAQLIATGLKERGYFHDPHVTVLVEQTNSKRLSV